MATIHPLKAYRLRRQLTQQQLGDQLRATKASVHRWENGRLPELEELNNIVNVTGIPPRAIARASSRSDLAPLFAPARARRPRRSAAARASARAA